MNNEKQFRLTLRRAARLALITRKINLSDWTHIQSVLLNSKRTTSDGIEVDLLEEIAFDIINCLQLEQKITAETNVESVIWNSILTLIQDLLPNIMEFIISLLDMFKMADVEPAPETPV
jgi:hypothetical protein